MATKKANIYGANEGTTNLAGNTTINPSGTPPFVLNGYPITFGEGEAAANTLTTIATKNDGKIRFVYDVKDNTTSTNSGAIYVGNKLASSKILDITTNATESATASLVTVKFINATNTVETLTFGVVDPSIVEALEARVAKLESWAEGSVVTEAENGAITVTPVENENGYDTYKVGVNVDDSTVKIVNNKLAVASYYIDKLSIGEDGYDAQFASQYRLMVKQPDAEKATYVQAGDTINIMKDFLLKDAHVCVFDLDVNGQPYTSTGEISGDIAVYAKVEKSAYAHVTVPGDTPIYLEKAPLDKNLIIGHTYLHLILNTTGLDEEGATAPSNNNLSSDVYLDFTEILGAASFQEMKDKIEEHDIRLDNIESSYVKSVSQVTKGGEGSGSQFNTVTITTASKDVSTATETTTSAATFDIPNQAYYTTVDGNFTTLQANDAYLAGLLAWTGLD